jgi:DNA-directed RNA polymerase specialized sigma24 family protein
MLNYKGETLPLAEVAERLGINYDALLSRVERGWPLEKVLRAEDLSRVKMLTAFGRTQSQQDWARELGIPRETIQSRLRRGKTSEQALKPSRKGCSTKQQRNLAT